jgi:hypothetical protein
MGPVRGREYRTPILSALSYRFAVRTDDESLGRQVDATLAGLRDFAGNAPARHWYSLTAADSPVGAFDVQRDDEFLARGQQPGDALGWVVWDVNRAAAEAGAEHILFHSGAVEAAATGILFPGASGSGKSTLVAGLVRSGFGYLTDELAAFDMTSGMLLPYAKPITVKPGSFAVLADMDPGAWPEPGSGHGVGQEWQVAVGEGTGRAIGTPCPPGFVIAPHFDADADTTLSPLSETQAFFALAVNAVNLVPHGSVGTSALGRLVGQCQCYSLAFSDLDEACRVVLELVAGETPPPTPVGRAGLEGAGRAL